MHLRHGDELGARDRANQAGDALERRQLYSDRRRHLRHGHDGLLFRLHRAFRASKERRVMFTNVHLRVDSIPSVARSAKHRPAHDESVAGRRDGFHSAHDFAGGAIEQQVAAAQERLAYLRRHLRARIPDVHTHYARTRHHRIRGLSLAATFSLRQRPRKLLRRHLYYTGARRSHCKRLSIVQAQSVDDWSLL